MEKVGAAALANIGANKEQLNGYKWTCPLAIYRQDDGNFTVIDCDGKHENMSQNELFDLLTMYGSMEV